MTPTIEDKARKVVADHAMGIQDEAVLLDQLGLMDEPVVVPELWSVHCDDPDCTACRLGPHGNILVQAPGDWDDEKILRRLSIQGHTCETGNQFAKAYAIVDFFSELILADICLG